MTGKVSKIINQSKRSGDKPKPDGTIYHWNIMTVEVETDTGKVIADSFDKLEVGNQVSLAKNDQYDSYNAKLYKSDSKDAKLDEILEAVKKILILVGGDNESLRDD